MGGWADRRQLSFAKGDEGARTSTTQAGLYDAALDSRQRYGRTALASSPHLQAPASKMPHRTEALQRRAALRCSAVAATQQQALHVRKRLWAEHEAPLEVGASTRLLQSGRKL